MKPQTIKVGSYVHYPTNPVPRMLKGVVDASSTASGDRLFRVADHWFEPGSLSVVVQQRGSEVLAR